MGGIIGVRMHQLVQGRHRRHGINRDKERQTKMRHPALGGSQHLFGRRWHHGRQYAVEAAVWQYIFWPLIGLDRGKDAGCPATCTDSAWGVPGGIYGNLAPLRDFPKCFSHGRSDSCFSRTASRCALAKGFNCGGASTRSVPLSKPSIVRIGFWDNPCRARVWRCNGPRPPLLRALAWSVFPA